MMRQTAMLMGKAERVNLGSPSQFSRELPRCFLRSEGREWYTAGRSGFSRPLFINHLHGGIAALDLDDLARSSGEWLRGDGPLSDFVISSRVRLARNIATFPFSSRCTPENRKAIEKLLRTAIEASPLGFSPAYMRIDDLSEVDRQFLVERHLISRELSEAEGARAVAIEENERVSLMVNEEDHLRMQVMRSGFALNEAWERMRDLDRCLGERLLFAFHPKRGYLTACPTNVGTGMRVSVMLHLPALAMTQQIEKVVRSLQKIGLAVRGLYGEGSQAMGDFYQVSNQITLGHSEEDLVKKVAEIIPSLIEWETRGRQHLLKEEGGMLHDRISRAHGILRTAQQISSEETMHLLSNVRMGVNLGLIPNLTMAMVNELFMFTQPAHLQKISGLDLGVNDRNVERAKFLREHLLETAP